MGSSVERWTMHEQDSPTEPKNRKVILPEPDWSRLASQLAVDLQPSEQELKEAWEELGKAITRYQQERVRRWMVARFPPDGSPALSYAKLAVAAGVSAGLPQIVVKQYIKRIAATVRKIRQDQAVARVPDLPVDQRLQQPLRLLGLDRYSYCALRRAGCETIGDVVALTERAVLAKDGLGPISLRRIDDQLSRIGLSLTAEESSDDLMNVPPDRLGLIMDLRSHIHAVIGCVDLTPGEAQVLIDLVRTRIRLK